MVAVLLSKNVLYFFGWVDQTHHQLHITLYPSGKDHWLALLIEIGEEVIEVFSFVNIEQAFILFEPKVKVLFSTWRHQVAFLIGSEGEGEHLVQLEHHCNFGWVFGRWEQFGFVLIGLKYGFDQIAFIFGFFDFRSSLLRWLFIRIKEASPYSEDQPFFDHNLIYKSSNRIIVVYSLQQDNKTGGQQIE